MKRYVSSTRSRLIWVDMIHRPDLVEEDGAARRRLELAFRELSAPVNAPFSWPKSSLATSSFGMAPV